MPAGRARAATRRDGRPSCCGRAAGRPRGARRAPRGSPRRRPRRGARTTSSRCRRARDPRLRRRRARPARRSPPRELRSEAPRRRPASRPRDQGRSAAIAPAANRAEQRVALRERLPVALAQVRAAGPAGRDKAVEVRAALGRRALDEDQPVGGEDRDRRAVARRAAGSTGLPSSRCRLPSARLTEASRRCAAPSWSRRSASARASGPEGDQLAPVAVRNERPVSAK